MKPQRHGDTEKNIKRNRLLATLFSKATKMGIEQEFLRDTITVNIIGKRLHEANSKEIFKVLEHLVKGSPSPRPSPTRGEEIKRYEPSRKGLLLELEDAARERWGEDFEKSLNTFINSHRKTPTHYRFLDVTTMKGIKERIRELNRENISHRDTEAQRERQ